jgi:hypothetical protein
MHWEDFAMADDHFTSDESRKLAVVIARVWADPQLARAYRQSPEAVLSGAGISLGGRTAPEIPEKPAELAAQRTVSAAALSSASSISCATCPCSGCTASCACAALKDDMHSHLDAMMKLAADPAGREQARKMMANWDIKLHM